MNAPTMQTLPCISAERADVAALRARSPCNFEAVFNELALCWQTRLYRQLVPIPCHRMSQDRGGLQTRGGWGGASLLVPSSSKFLVARQTRCCVDMDLGARWQEGCSAGASPGGRFWVLARAQLY